MLFSRIVALRMPNALENTRNRVMDRTAMGTDAETVSPTLRTRYRDDAPNTIPRIPPRRTGTGVNSGIRASSGTYGLCSATWPSVGVLIGTGLPGEEGAGERVGASL